MIYVLSIHAAPQNAQRVVPRPSVKKLLAYEKEGGFAKRVKTLRGQSFVLCY